MKTNVRIVAVLLALVAALSVEARPVSQSEAALVARAWAARGGTLGVRFPTQAERTTRLALTNDVVAYAVKMERGGTIFLSGDTADEPIVCFTGDTADYSEIDKDSPLWGLLNADQSARRQGRTKSPVLKLSTSSASTAAASSANSQLANEKKWLALLAEGRQLDSHLRLKTSSGIASPDDVRVAPLVQSQWGQSTVADAACYNYHTPLGYKQVWPDNPDNAVCGCVATAMAQVMRYWEFPKTEVPKVTRTCQFNFEDVELTTIGGIYDWDKMTLRPKTEGVTTESREMIGRLTSDCGITVSMNYGTPFGSSASTGDVKDALTAVFGYKNALWAQGEDSDKTIDPNRFPTLLFANFDAGCPVQMSISGDRGGHSVVGDGYGYNEDKPYVHLNMGWNGQDDLWYNLPNIGTDYSIFRGVVYNIFPEKTGYILSGRIEDDEESPVENASVSVYNAATGEKVATMKTGANGIYAFILGGGVYDVVATSEDGTLTNDQSGINLETANSWGNNLELALPTVRIGAEVFPTLDRALNAAREGDLVEVLLPTILKNPVTVAYSYTLIATNEDVWASVVTRRNDAMITVADGVTLSVSNIAFKVAEAAKTVKVEDGGVLKVSGTCALEAIETVDKDNLVVAAGLTWHFLVDCKGAKSAGSVFATATVDPAAVCASQLFHYSNTRLGGEAFVGDHKVCIKWSKDAPVPLNGTVGQLDVGTGRVNYRALNDLFADYAGDADALVVVRKSTKFTNYLKDIPHAIAIVGEWDGRSSKPIVKAEATSGFNIPEGGSLTISNVVFGGYNDTNDTDDHGFIAVNGGALTLAAGAELNGITGRVKEHSGVIDLNKGVVTMEDGAVIANCSAEGVNGKGGAIYVDCETGCTLNLRGGTIMNCHAAYYGGGVYVYNYSLAWSPKVNLSGPLTISGNSAGGNLKHADDLCWITANAETMPLFKVVGPIAGSVGVRFSTHIDGKPTGEAEGDAFITNAIGAAADERTFRSFFSNATACYIAANGTGEKAGKLVWIEDPYDPRQCDESEAAAKLIDGKFVTFWREVSDALNEATDGCIVEVIAADEYVPLSSKVVVKGKDITLRSKSGAPAAKNLLRDKDVQVYIPGGSELVLTNINVVGCDLAAAEWTTNTVALFDVDGGKLDVRNSLIQYVFGNGERNANAITVYNGGTLEMSTGAQIDSCYNLTEDAASGNKANAGAGGGILVEKATAYLHDVSVIGCLGTWGGGVCADNEAKVFLSGSSSVAFNYTPDYACYSNIQLSDNSDLFLDGELTDAVGVTSLEYSINRPGVTNVVAKVDTGWKWNVTSLTNSAAHFERDLDGELAVAVTNGTKALIVWCGAVKDGIYTQVEDDVTVKYALVGEMPVAPPPAALLLPELRDGSAVAGALARMSDATVGAKIATLSEYNAFRDWADGVTGGKESVAESDKAYVSYQFGTTSLLESDPTVEITEIENAEGGLKVSVIVKDGEDPVAVAAANVAKMFEATSDLDDWTKRVDLAVTDPVANGDGSVTFTVKPTGNPPAAFIRLAY